jgi:hypothetical protein
VFTWRGGGGIDPARRARDAACGGVDVGSCRTRVGDRENPSTRFWGGEGDVKNTTAFHDL